MLPTAPVFLAVLAAGLLLAPVAAAQTPPPAAAPAPPAAPRIAPGVSSAGVDLSNLTVPEAAARLEQALAAPLARNVAVSVAGKRFRLRMKRIRLRMDAERTAKRAYYAGRDSTQPAGTPLAVAPAVSFRRAAIRDFADGIDRRVYVSPRDATLRITTRRMVRRRSKTGRDLDARGLRTAIEKTVADPGAARVLTPGRRVIRPRVTADELARAYPTVLTIDRSDFRLRLFKGLRLSRTYGIAVGAAGYDTPGGRYRIQNKQVDPPWSAPNKPWAGLYAGRTVPGGAPDNPLRARWLGIANGVGIHGTAAEYSIGSRASHGCIRMRVADVIDLYRRVPVGTPVQIS